MLLSFAACSDIKGKSNYILLIEGHIYARRESAKGWDSKAIFWVQAGS